MTPAYREGGSCHQVGHDTNIPDPPVHMRGGQSPVSTAKHAMALREVAHWTPTDWIHPQGIAEVGALCAGYSAGGYGFLLFLDSDRWAHPWVATTVWGSGHWTLGHGNAEFVQGWREGYSVHGHQVRPLLDSTRSCLTRWGQRPGLLGHQFWPRDQ